MTQITEVSLAILDVPVSSLELSKRVMNCLEDENIKTIGDLVKVSLGELKRGPGFGKVAAKELVDRLATVGIGLNDERPPATVTEKVITAEEASAERSKIHNREIVENSFFPPDWIE